MEHNANIVAESNRISNLQRRIARIVPVARAERADRVSLGPAIDARIGGGLARGRLHEVVAADGADAAAAAGFAAMLARRIAIDGRHPLVWLRLADAHGALYPPGLAEVGIDPARVLLVLAPDAEALLRAAGDVVRCSAVGTAVVELWRDPRRIDLTDGRRLMLAAEASGTTPVLLRIAVEPIPCAAQTRWAVCAAPSTPLAADAPGGPALTLELLRQRGGPAGFAWRVEWDRDQTEFRAQFRSAAPLPGAVAAVPDGGSLAPRIHAVG